ncbi:MAG: thrombospondin type 3 repeat-containing protein [Deltaproteobacteria bacterium]|nr:thrombospondin type 3 repeat-containing protein [Deltaproteobacteria bacterium]
MEKRLMTYIAFAALFSPACGADDPSRNAAAENPAQSITATSADIDGDGLPDDWEASAEGKALGAQVGRKDIFFHIDWSYCTDAAGNFNPVASAPFSRENVRFAIEMFRDRLGSESWCAHIDNGETIWDCDDLSKSKDASGKTKLWFNEKRRGLAQARMIQSFKLANGNDDDQKTYDVFFPKSRAKRFHYGQSGCSGGGASTKGDLVVMFGNSGEAMIHEFGHKFGLEHGGADQTNYKPNYLSLMNYSYSYIDIGFTAAKAQTLNEFETCESLGLNTPLKLGTEMIGGFAIPKELVPFVNANSNTGVAKPAFPAKLVRANGAIDWNGDGVIDTCGSGVRESNIDLDFGDFPLVKDIGPARASSTGFAPSLVNVSGKLWALFVDKKGKLAVAQGPSSVTWMRNQLKSKMLLDASIFNSPTVVSIPSYYGAVASSPSAIVANGKPEVFVQTSSGTILRLTLSQSATPAVEKIAPIYQPSSGMPVCGVTAAYNSAQKTTMVVTRACATGAIIDISGFFPGLIGESSTAEPALVFDAKGDVLLFGAKPGDATHPCGGPDARLFVRKIPVKSGGAATTTWVWDTANSCGHQASVVTGRIGAIFDPSPKRSKNGRVYLFFKGKQPPAGSGTSYKLSTVHYDLFAQTEPLGMKAIVGKIHGPLFDWGEFQGGKTSSTYGAASAATGLVFEDRAVMLYVQCDTNGADDGRLVLGPSADGITKTAIVGYNDVEHLHKEMPISITVMSDPAGPASASNVPGGPYALSKLGVDSNGNGVPDAYDGVDTDGDGIIDSDDADRDGDGACDVLNAALRPEWCTVIDNCPTVKNPTQADTDGDGQGDACDGDIDGDGVANVFDACPYDKNGSIDKDGDGVCDETDNCVLPPQGGVYPSKNASQVDSNGNGVGDACETGANLKVDDIKVGMFAIDIVSRVWGATTNTATSPDYLKPVEGQAAIGVCICTTTDCASCPSTPSAYTKVEAWSQTFERETKFVQTGWWWFDHFTAKGLITSYKCGSTKVGATMVVPKFCQAPKAPAVRLMMFSRKSASSRWASGPASDPFVLPKFIEPLTP